MNSTERIPLYQKIQAHIRNLIDTEGLRSGERIPTEKELMELFNVSKITVVNALTGLAGDGVITRVPGRGSFVSAPSDAPSAEPSPSSAEAAPTVSSAAEPAKRTGQSVRTGIIGLIMPSVHDYFAARLIQGITDELAEKGYRFVILPSGESLASENEAIQTLMEMGAEGMLIFPVDEEQYNVEIIGMKLSGYPFMLIDRYLPGVETNYIAADGKKGAKLAVEHLWSLGHREIAICSDSPLQTVTVQERIQGYMDALKDKGALINPAHIITDFRLNGPEDTVSHPLYRYIRNRMATAYISLNSQLGVHIYRMARQAGFTVPGDLSIVSFDDPTSILEELSVFTHIKQFEYEMGRRAAKRLLEIVELRSGGTADEYSKIVIAPELVVRQSTGPLAAGGGDSSSTT